MNHTKLIATLCICPCGGKRHLKLYRTKGRRHSFNFVFLLVPKKDKKVVQKD